MFDTNRFKATLVLNGLKAEDVARLLGVNITTYYRKLNNDGDFSRSEINTMIDSFQIEDPISIFFAKELT